MANIVHADPFGSYVRGQDQGQKQAIDLATAQRSFRDSDVNAEYKKWYIPHLQDEVRRKEESEKLAYNQAYFKQLALLASTGNPVAVQHALEFIRRAYPDMDIDEKDPMKVAQAINTMAGNYPAAFNLDKGIYAAQGYGRMPDMTGLSQPGGAQSGDPIKKMFDSLFGPAPGATSDSSAENKPIDLRPPSVEKKNGDIDVWGDSVNAPAATATATTTPAVNIPKVQLNPLAPTPDVDTSSGNPPWQPPNYGFSPEPNPQVAEHTPTAQYHQDLGTEAYGKPAPAPITIPKAVTTPLVNAPTAGVGFYGSSGGNEGLVRKRSPANKQMASQ